MRFLFVFFVLLAVSVTPMTASAAGSTSGAHGPTVPGPLVSDFDELATMFDSTVCSDCHDELYEQWTHSKHGHSFSSERLLQTWRTFIKQGLEREKNLTKMDIKSHCLWCHAPAIKYSSDELTAQIIDMIVTAVDDPDKAKREATRKELSRLNLNCYGCHNMFALKDGYWGNKPEVDAIYGPTGNVDPDNHNENVDYINKTIKSDYLASPKFCARCHHGCPDSVPFWQCQTLYTSYMENYIAKGGDKRCQDCHMKKPDADTWAEHTFPGVHDKEFFADAMEIEIEAEPTHFIDNYKNALTPTLCLKVKITSHSGHGLPNG